MERLNNITEEDVRNNPNIWDEIYREQQAIDRRNAIRNQRTGPVRHRVKPLMTLTQKRLKPVTKRRQPKKKT